MYELFKQDFGKEIRFGNDELGKDADHNLFFSFQW
jgi:hypothetical protein